MTSKLHGLRELQQQLKDLGDTVLASKVLAKAARDAFRPVLEAAKSMVPRDSGALADSLMLATRRNPDGSVSVGIKIGRSRRAKQAAIARAVFGGDAELPPARRWHFVEFGTAHQAAHPFLRPALDTRTGQVLEGLKKHLREGIARAIAKRK